MFRYDTGREVRLGDIVRVWDGRKWRPGVVAEVLLPGTPEAEGEGHPEGGILVLSEASGAKFWGLPDGRQWEDLEFVRRAGGSGNTIQNSS